MIFSIVNPIFLVIFHIDSISGHDIWIFAVSTHFVKRLNKHLAFTEKKP